MERNKILKICICLFIAIMMISVILSGCIVTPTTTPTPTPPLTSTLTSTPPMQEPPLPSFDEEAFISPEDIEEMDQTASSIDQAGGPSAVLVSLLHELQSQWAILFEELDKSTNNEEIPLLLDALHVTIFLYKNNLDKLTTPDAQITQPVAEVALGEFGAAKNKIDQALQEFVIALGASPDEIVDVAVVVPKPLVVTVAEKLQISVDEFERLLARIPPEQRLTIISTQGSIIISPSGVPFPQPPVSWWGKIWGGIKGVGTKALAKAALAVKLGHLMMKYGNAIVDCYSHHFPNWSAIENCLTEKHGLAKDVVTRILTAIMDP